MKTHHGSCHCGAVTYTVQSDITDAIDCNCSFCSVKAPLLAAVPKAALTIEGEENLALYNFNTHVINHRFCKTCGVQTHSHAVMKDGSEMAMINIRTLTDLDLATITITPFDGKSR